MIRNFFSPPVFQKENDNFRAKFIFGFSWIVIIILLILVGIYLFGGTTDYTIFILTGLIIVLLTAIALLRQGKITASGMIIVVLGWIGLGLQAFTADGVRDVIVVAYISIGLLASIVISLQAGTIVIVSSIGAIWALAFLETNGHLTPSLQSPLNFARDMSFVFTAITALIYFSTTSLRDAISRAAKSEEGLLATNKQLQELNQSLEDRVFERTSELEKANQHNEKRARQFEAVAQVARATTSNEKIESLLPRLSALISEQFGFYHTGIFLLDENREFAILSAANSEGGKRMMERGHKLPIGQTGIVGFVSATGTPRIALDVGSDAVYFDNPDLSNTHSEMALPLSVTNEIIGVLDVQSTEARAFSEEDIEILSTLADQVAVAIQNARNFETLQELLESAQRTSGEYINEAWRILQSENTNLGFRANGNEVSAISRPLSSAHVRKAIESRVTVKENGDRATLAIPIRLRNEVIGVMDIQIPEQYEWDEDEVDIAEAVADRLALALESSLLLKSTQKRAELERITTDISVKIGATTQFESILRTAAEELSRALGGSDVLVQVQPGQLENLSDANQENTDYENEHGVQDENG